MFKSYRESCPFARVVTAARFVVVTPHIVYMLWKRKSLAMQRCHLEVVWRLRTWFSACSSMHACWRCYVIIYKASPWIRVTRSLQRGWEVGLNSLLIPLKVGRLLRALAKSRQRRCDLTCYRKKDRLFDVKYLHKMQR